MPYCDRATELSEAGLLILQWSNHDSVPLKIHFKCVPFGVLLVHSASPHISKCAKPADDLATGCVDTVGLCFSSVLKSLKIPYNSQVYWANATEKGIQILS